MLLVTNLATLGRDNLQIKERKVSLTRQKTGTATSLRHRVKHTERRPRLPGLRILTTLGFSQRAASARCELWPPEGALRGSQPGRARTGGHRNYRRFRDKDCDP